MWRCGGLLLWLALAGCAQETPPVAAAPALDLHAPVTVVEWALPSLRPGTHSPGLSATHDGRLLLSWINSQRGRRHVFQFSGYDLTQQRWRGAPLTVVIGNSLHLDGVHLPQMAASADGALWAQWWQSAGRSSEPYRRLSHSRDGGGNWSEPRPFDELGSAAQALFSPNRGADLAWMDGLENSRQRVIASLGDTIVMAWMALDEPVPVLKLALSKDAGMSFLTPLELLQGETVSPFALALDAHQVWLLWRQEDEDGVQSLWLSRRSVDLQQEFERREIARETPARLGPDHSGDIPPDVGIPQFALHQGTGYLVWTRPAGAQTGLRGVKLLTPPRVAASF